MSGQQRIVYQGEPGANSHLAVLEARPGAEPVGADTFEDCFDALLGGDCELALIPLENSIAGRVADVHHLLPGSDVHIVGEHFQPIRLHLLAVPGARIDELRTAESHLHALGQCRRIIRKLGLTPVEAGDTARAARLVADAGDPTRAALATDLAAQIHGLDVLARDVQDAAHNATRFVMLSREPEEAPPGVEAITTFMFRVRNIPAALYKALGGFATNGVNMTKLESYQLDGSFNATQFYADVEGHRQDRAVARALDELAYFCSDMRVLGSYPRHPFRDHRFTLI